MLPSPRAQPRGHSPDEVPDNRHTLGIHLHGDPAARLLPQAVGLGVGGQDQLVGAHGQLVLLPRLHPDEQVTALLALKDLL